MAARRTEINETENFNYSRYGGYLNKRVKSTGFFRTEQIDDRWWLIDPDGYLFLSYGVDCVAPVGDYYTKNTDKCTNMFQELPPRELFVESKECIARNTCQPLSVSGTYIVDTEKLSRPSCRNDNQKNGQVGIEYPCKLVRIKLYDKNRKAFILPLENIGFENELMGLMDVYDNGIEKKIDEAIVRNVAKYKNNHWLINISSKRTCLDFERKSPVFINF